MEITNNIQHVILPSEDFIASCKMCARCGDDRELQNIGGDLMCYACRIDSHIGTDERRVEPYAPKKEKLETLQYLKILKPIKNMEYPVGFILKSSLLFEGRFYVWYINKRHKRKCRMLSKEEVTVLLVNEYIKYIDKNEI